MRMRHAHLWAATFGLILAAGAGRALAEEGGAKDQKKPAVQKSAEDALNTFTDFWKHDVGDTIYSGLKTGARKIRHFFTGGSKEKDAQKEKPAEAKPSAGPTDKTGK